MSDSDVGCEWRRCFAELYQPGSDLEEQTHTHGVIKLQFGAAEEVKEGEACTDWYTAAGSLEAEASR